MAAFNHLNSSIERRMQCGVKCRCGLAG
jgi:hypothetical protein